jgi:hypothetical protein
MAVALGLATLAGALGLTTRVERATPFVASPRPTTLNQVSVSAGGAIAAPMHAPAAGRDWDCLRARESAPAPQATEEVWEKTDVSYWRHLVASEEHDDRAFLLATAFQRWIPSPLLATPRSPVVLPSKEG